MRAMKFFPTPSRATPKDNYILGEQIRFLFGEGPVVGGATLAAMLLLITVLAIHGNAPWRVIAIWAPIYIVLVACHLLLCILYWNRRAVRTDWHRWGCWFALICLAEGLTWGIGSIWLRGWGDLNRELLVMLVMAAAASGSMFSLASYRPAAYLFMISAVAPLLLCFFVGDSLHAVLGLLVILFMISFSIAGWRASANFNQILHLQFDNATMAQDLQLQKNLADQANIDKSRFLAAASHDLRQPVHALEMLVGTLKGHHMKPDARHVVDQIGQSLEGLRGLFDSLLNMSQLDAGVVIPNPRPFLLAPLLERIRRDFELEAETKGIELRVHPCTAAVLTDPFLLERILRNIVSNSVRYTDSGHVVIRCRRRHRLHIQVWDTGLGIQPEQRELIFREFYQIGNPERDRARGVGLGLAIVSRLATLIGCPVTVHSRLGRGSLFTVVVPFAQEPAVPLTPVASPRDTSDRQMILLVEDDVSIRNAMVGLLTDQGYLVVAATTCSEMICNISTQPIKPGLIISDYRLRDGETAFSVIDRLRSEFNEDIPAMVITGDTGPEQLQEAQRSGLLLLHKPVSSTVLLRSITSIFSSVEKEPPLRG